MPEPVSIAETPPQGQLLLRLTAEARARAAEALGFEIPERPLTASAAEGARCLWLGPDEWLLTMPPDRVVEVEQALRAALAGTHHAIVEVSDRTIIIAIEGPSARHVLAAGSPLDLHPRAFPPGSVARGTFGKTVAILHHVGENVFELHVDRSQIGYVADFLADAARDEFCGGASVAPAGSTGAA
jgi:sarcosine oxidase subunit gamma